MLEMTRGDRKEIGDRNRKDRIREQIEVEDTLMDDQK